TGVNNQKELSGIYPFEMTFQIEVRDAAGENPAEPLLVQALAFALVAEVMRNHIEARFLRLAMTGEKDDHHVFWPRRLESLQILDRSRHSSRRRRARRITCEAFERREHIGPGRLLVQQPDDFDPREAAQPCLLTP